MLRLMKFSELRTSCATVAANRPSKESFSASFNRSWSARFSRSRSTIWLNVCARRPISSEPAGRQRDVKVPCGHLLRAFHQLVNRLGETKSQVKHHAQCRQHRSQNPVEPLSVPHAGQGRNLVAFAFYHGVPDHLDRRAPGGTEL